MDPHPTPFPGRRRPAAATAAAARAAMPKPKSIAGARAKMAKKSPAGAGGGNAAGETAQPRPKRAFGTVRSTNVPAEKAQPPQQQKPLKVSPPKMGKATVLSKPSRPAAKPIKKVASVLEPEAKAKKKTQRVSFQGEVAVAGTGEKLKAATEDAAGHTPMVSVKAMEQPAAVSVETPFFSAQDCSNCRLDQLELATYWLTQVRLAESVGKHSVSAAFFRLAFECQAQPIHRIQSELRNYLVRHESAGASSPLFNELVLAHGMPVNQPKFDADGFEKVDAPLQAIDDKLDSTALEVECLEYDFVGDLVDVGHVTIGKQGNEGMEQPSFERKLEETFEFDDCEAIVLDQLEEAHSEAEKNATVKVPCISESVSPACKSSSEKLSLKGSPAVRVSSSRQLSSRSPCDKCPPSARSSSAKRFSSGSPLAKKSPFGRGSSTKLLSSNCPSDKKSPSSRSSSSKRLSSGSRADEEPNAIAGDGTQSRRKQEGKCESPALGDQLELRERGDDSVINKNC